MKYPNDIVAEIKKANRKSDSLVFFMDKERKIGFLYEDASEGYQFNYFNYSKWKDYVLKKYDTYRKKYYITEDIYAVGTEKMITRLSGMSADTTKAFSVIFNNNATEKIDLSSGCIMSLGEMIDKGLIEEPDFLNNTKWT